jgi:hypothetical protein
MSANGDSKLAKVDDVRAFMRERLNDSLSSTLLKCGVKYGTPFSENLLWELLTLLVENEGSVWLPSSSVPHHPSRS